MATAQRGNLYAPGCSEKARKKFHGELAEQLEQLGKKYQRPMSDEDHLGNIVALANRLSAAHSDVLRGGQFRIGSCQKAVNLYLKYIWCLGMIPAPPHCPFDGLVISRLRDYRGKPWTKLESPDDYLDLVAKARSQAKGLSLPEWELQIYNELAISPSPIRS